MSPMLDTPLAAEPSIQFGVLDYTLERKQYLHPWARYKVSYGASLYFKILIVFQTRSLLY